MSKTQRLLLSLTLVSDIGGVCWLIDCLKVVDMPLSGTSCERGRGSFWLPTYNVSNNLSRISKILVFFWWVFMKYPK